MAKGDEGGATFGTEPFQFRVAEVAGGLFGGAALRGDQSGDVNRRGGEGDAETLAGAVDQRQFAGAFGGAQFMVDIGGGEAHWQVDPVQQV